GLEPAGLGRDAEIVRRDRLLLVRQHGGERIVGPRGQRRGRRAFGRLLERAGHLVVAVLLLHRPIRLGDETSAAATVSSARGPHLCSATRKRFLFLPPPRLAPSPVGSPILPPAIAHRPFTET